MDDPPSDPEPPRLSILVVDDEVNIRKTIAIALEGVGHRVTTVSNARDALEEARRRPHDLALVDLRLGASSGLDLIPALLADSPWLEVVVITAYASIDTAVEAMRRGASDYLPKPFTPAQLLALTDKVVRVRALEGKVQALQDALRQEGLEADLSSANAAMRRAMDLARQVASSDATVLLRGESGTGKGILARAIHALGDRASKPFTIVSCPSLAPELLESELFGHVKGAFTGAVRDGPGRIAASEGGTLFLDEIGDLPQHLQPKLLRFVQDREYERVGDTFTRRADVRLIAATNADLESAVKGGRFREDLYYRFNVFPIEIPPLRDRPEDIVPLATRFLATLSRTKALRGFDAEALEILRRYSWPGNVRELRNAIERAVILCRGETIGPEHLPSGLRPEPSLVGLGDRVALERVEEEHIRRILASTRTLEEAAAVLQIDAATLWRRRKKYGI